TMPFGGGDRDSDPAIPHRHGGHPAPGSCLLRPLASRGLGDNQRSGAGPDGIIEKPVTIGLASLHRAEEKAWRDPPRVLGDTRYVRQDTGRLHQLTRSFQGLNDRAQVHLTSSAVRRTELPTL